MDFHSLKVKQITPETPDTITLEFEVPSDLQPKFQFLPGQHITLRVQLDGQELRRSYSMSAAPHEGRLAVTVKKVVPGGRVSAYIYDWVKEGTVLDVSIPDGRFVVRSDVDKRRTFFLFAAGSGITPVISIAKELLEREPMCTIYLLYGSRNEENIIFKKELDQLAERYGGQFNVEYTLSRPKKEGGGLFGFFKNSSWSGRTGRIDARMVGEFVEEYLIQGPEDEAQYFICGPGDMADLVKAALLGRGGIAAKQIHTEHFVNSGQAPGMPPPTDTLAAKYGKGTKLIAYLKGQKIETTIAPDTTVLDALIREKHDAPYSCTAGACATCMAKVLHGAVKMDACYALDDDEVASGYILTCQSRPETSELEISYDL